MIAICSVRPLASDRLKSCDGSFVLQLPAESQQETTILVVPGVIELWSQKPGSMTDENELHFVPQLTSIVTGALLTTLEG